MAKKITNHQEFIDKLSEISDYVAIAMDDSCKFWWAYTQIPYIFDEDSTSWTEGSIDGQMLDVDEVAELEPVDNWKESLFISKHYKPEHDEELPR